MWAQSSRWLLVNGCASAVSCWRGRRLRPQFGDQPQNLLEHLPGNGDLGHLKGDITAVAHDLRANLDQPFLESRQRPIFDRLRRRQRAQEIPEIVSQRMKLDLFLVGLYESWNIPVPALLSVSVGVLGAIVAVVLAD